MTQRSARWSIIRRVPAGAARVPLLKRYLVERVRILRLRAGDRLRRLPVGRGRGAAVRAARRIGAAVALVDGRWHLAEDLGGSSLRGVRFDNLAATSALLQRAGVTHHARDASGPGPGHIVVSDEGWAAVPSALASADPADLLYARHLDGSAAVLLPASQAAARRLSAADRLVVYRATRISDRRTVGADKGAVIERWVRTGARIDAPRGARPGRVLLGEEAPATLDVGYHALPSLSQFVDDEALVEPAFPIDAVFTWVDDSDPAWVRAKEDARARWRDGAEMHEEAANAARFRNRDELRYALRSMALNASFIRRIFIVTAGHAPPWLDTSDARVRLVRHDEILDDSCLPTFNSHAIESALHRIDGLAEHYLYVNDDFFFGREVAARTFFCANGVPRFFPDRRAPIPSGPPVPTDRPVDAAAKNARDLVASELGVRAPWKMQHAPYPQRRSILLEAEERFAEAFGRTAANRFRHHDDLSVASCFAHYFAYGTGRAVLGEIEAEYINIANRWAPLRMQRLLRERDRDVFCLNETDVPPERIQRVERLVGAFLEEHDPVPSPFERAPT